MSTAFDFSPLYRSMIGVDRMADLAEAASRSNADAGYPPFDVEKTGQDSYRVTIAAAGFSSAELEVTAQPNLLVVSGKKARTEKGERNFLHRGVAMRDFERRFELADHVVVRSASHADGLLTVELEREVPEALKPRRIEIGQAPQQRLTGPDKARKAA
ncbi:Hsp20 family protein [Caulobacter sp. UNC279MFTsu5.1]|uniref:Hsp20 family protein n=1 Tax=Caulobacter sp. UNC279MFTsu5.1 TaxID=1502775 RepID=UPI00039FC288|nr:Hsp20 family protein [Caulobacter sp. UNC279MFTsu5.1]SFJ29631.1 molecular chaperone IbpA [Caulobacter sp. UNC279MFTsu5.1]